ncbi:hypothetical protein Tco_1316791 [Tanacetum coccineum]
MSDSDESGVTYTKVSSPFKGPTLSRLRAGLRAREAPLHLVLCSRPREMLMMMIDAEESANVRMPHHCLVNLTMSRKSDSEAEPRLMRMRRRRRSTQLLPTLCRCCLLPVGSGPICGGYQKPYETDESAGHTTTTPCILTAGFYSCSEIRCTSSGITTTLDHISSYFINTIATTSIVVGESSYAIAARPAGGLRADYGFVATIDREIRRDPEREVGYGITDSWDEIVETLQGAPSQRQLLAGQLNYVVLETQTEQCIIYTVIKMETEARIIPRGLGGARWYASDSSRTRRLCQSLYRTRSDVQKLRVACYLFRRRQVTALQGQQGPAGGPAQPELPEEAGSSS